MPLPPVPKWKPTIAVDVERAAKTFAYYMDGRVSFAVMANGTCVLVPPQGDAEAAAMETLFGILHAHPDMNPRPMDDGNWLITYSGPAATVVFIDVVEANWDYIEKHHLQGLADAEVLINARGEANNFDRTGKLALFGRAYMFMDALSPKMVKLCRGAEDAHQ